MLIVWSGQHSSNDTVYSTGRPAICAIVSVVDGCRRSADGSKNEERHLELRMRFSSVIMPKLEPDCCCKLSFFRSACTDSKRARGCPDPDHVPFQP